MGKNTLTPGSKIRDGKIQIRDQGAGINIPDPQQWSQIKQELGKKLRKRSQGTYFQVKKKKRIFYFILVLVAVQRSVHQHDRIPISDVW